MFSFSLDYHNTHQPPNASEVQNDKAEMDTSLLFVTALSADAKVINRLLLYLHDWEGVGDCFHLVTSRSVSFLLGKFTAREQEFVPTSAPVAEDLINEWSGASMADVEAFCLEVDRKRAEEEGDDSRIMGRAHLFVVLDEEGLNITGGTWEARTRGSKERVS